MTEQLDFCVALFRKRPRFSHDTFAGAAALGPAGEWDNTIGAGLVAALNDGYVGAVRIVPASKRSVKSLIGIETQTGNPALARLKLDKHLGQPGVACRTGHQIHMRSTFEDTFAFLLRDAPDHPEKLALAGLPLELLQAVENLLFRFIADTAGVIQNQLGVFRLMYLRVALLQKRAHDLL